MRSVEDKSCCNYGPTKDISSSNAINFEFPKGNGTNRSSHHRTALGKPTPSKWDDAQKWLVGLSRGGEKNQSKTNPRNSNADDRRLIAPVPVKEKDYSDEGEEEEAHGETKKVDCDESFWQINKHVEDPTSAVRSICVRDMGTEMTPIASQEPSRTATPIRATTPVARSPISSGSSTPVRCYQTSLSSTESRGEAAHAGRRHGKMSSDGEESNACKMPENKNSENTRKYNNNNNNNNNNNPLDTRATAWDEAERAKFLARYKREEVKIQAWENHEKRKAEMEMKRMEVKADKLKARAQEKLSNKVAATRRIAEEKRANAEAKLNEKAARTSERADYIRRTGHLPSSFYFKLPSLCTW